MKQLPEHIIEKAYVSPGAREFAWRRADLKMAFESIVDSGQAILCGEVWLVKDESKNWIGLIPSNDNSPPGVWHWETTSRMPDETWEEYCHKTLTESLKATSEMKVEEESAQDVLQYLWFNVFFVEEGEL